jgi:hypothetical protein
MVSGADFLIRKTSVEDRAGKQPMAELRCGSYAVARKPPSERTGYAKSPVARAS